MSFCTNCALTAAHRPTTFSCNSRRICWRASYSPRVLETTALGAAYLAGLAVGFWKDRLKSKHWQLDAILSQNESGRTCPSPRALVRAPNARVMGEEPELNRTMNRCSSFFCLKPATCTFNFQPILRFVWRNRLLHAKLRGATRVGSQPDLSHLTLNLFNRSKEPCSKT